MGIFSTLCFFIGSGLLDGLINHVQKQYVTEENNNAYLISGFLSAAVIGFTLLLIQYALGPPNRYSLSKI
jgi:hypothetical protein